MPWLTPDECLGFLELSLLSELTHDPKKSIAVLVASATAGQTVIPTRFFGSAGQGWIVRVDGVLTTAYSVQEGLGTRSQDQLTMNAGLTAGARVTASCVGAVDVTVLDEKLVDGQNEVRGNIDSAGYIVPDDDAAGVHRTLRRWAWDCAAWQLLTDARRAGLIRADGSGPYSNVEARYQRLAVGHGPGMPSIFALVRSGGYSLRGVCEKRVVTASDGDTPDEFQVATYRSSRKIFGDRAGVL